MDRLRGDSRGNGKHTCSLYYLLCNKPFVLTRNSLLLLSIHHIVSGDAEVESVRISIKYSLSINCSSLKYTHFYCYLSCIVWNNIVKILSRNERERRDQDENQKAAVWAEYEPAPRVLTNTPLVRTVRRRSRERRCQFAIFEQAFIRQISS